MIRTLCNSMHIIVKIYSIHHRNMHVCTVCNISSILCTAYFGSICFAQCQPDQAENMQLILKMRAVHRYQKGFFHTHLPVHNSFMVLSAYVLCCLCLTVCIDLNKSNQRHSRVGCDFKILGKKNLAKIYLKLST